MKFYTNFYFYFLFLNDYLIYKKLYACSYLNLNIKFLELLKSSSYVVFLFFSFVCVYIYYMNRRIRIEDLKLWDVFFTFFLIFRMMEITELYSGKRLFHGMQSNSIKCPPFNLICN